MSCMRDKLENALKKGSFSEEVFLRCCRAQEFYYESQIPVTQEGLKCEPLTYNAVIQIWPYSLVG